MPLYFFHTKDGEAHVDEIGLELADVDAAKAQATTLLAELLQNNTGLLWQTEQFNITVTDEDGLTLFIVHLAAFMSPSVGTRRGQHLVGG